MNPIERLVRRVCPQLQRVIKSHSDKIDGNEGEIELVLVRLDRVEKRLSSHVKNPRSVK